MTPIRNREVRTKAGTLLRSSVITRDDGNGTYAVELWQPEYPTTAKEFNLSLQQAEQIMEEFFS